MIVGVMGIVLASSSKYRQQVLAAAGIEARIVAPEFDERALDSLFGTMEPGEFAVRLATGKARSVAGEIAVGELVLAADQLAVLGDRMLSKPADLDAAIEQLISMSGTTHELINGLVVWNTATDRWATAIDVHRVTMRDFTLGDAAAYVERFEPLDSVGAYRVEDDADLIASVEGSGDDGVMGLPIRVVRELLGSVAGDGDRL